AVAASDHEEILRLVEREVADLNLESAMCFDRQGRLLAHAGDPFPDPSEVARLYPHCPAAGFRQQVFPATGALVISKCSSPHNRSLILRGESWERWLASLASP